MPNVPAGALGRTRRLCAATEGAVYDISCPVAGDMSTRPITAVARCCPICIVFSFLLRHPSDPVSRRNPRRCGMPRPHKRGICTRTYAQEETCASVTIGLTRFIFWTGPADSSVQGCAMQKYNQYCPVSRATEILGDRWTLLIVREMILGSHRFNDIEAGLPGISRSLLTSRLRNLVDAGIVERLPGTRPTLAEYHLSAAG